MRTDNMIFRLNSTQIIPFWDAIKYACVRADSVPKSEMQSYFNNLLHDLLSDKAQCFVVLTPGRILNSVVITRVTADKFLTVKELHIQCLYSMATLSNEDLIDHFSFIGDFAKSQGCKLITYHSSNPRIWEIAEVLGCEEQFRSFSLDLGGE